MARQEIINQNGYIENIGIVVVDFNDKVLVRDDIGKVLYKGLFNIVKNNTLVVFKNIIINLDPGLSKYNSLILSFSYTPNDPDILSASYWLSDVYYGSISVESDDTIQFTTL